MFRSLRNSSFGLFLEVTTLRQLVSLPSWIASRISDVIIFAGKREKEVTLRDTDAEQNSKSEQNSPERIISYQISIQS